MTTTGSNDPFDALALPVAPQQPRPKFVRDLRARLLDELGIKDPATLPTVELPERKSAMTASNPSTAAVDHDVVGKQPGDTIPAADRPGTGAGIWAGVYYADALAGIRFLVDVFGFEEQLVVVGPDGSTVVHSQLRWPEGGIVQVGTENRDNEFTLPAGAQALYVVTADPYAVWERCQAAGVEVIRPPESPDYDPNGMGFSVRDREGNKWSFGTYGLGETI